MTHVSVTVNGEPREADVEPRTLLVYFLRETLGLTGTNVGCDTSTCGTCTVLLDGESVKSCTLLAAQADGREVTTIEGMADGDDMHPLQEAFHRNHGLQCGYCTPGMMMAAASYLKENPSPTEEEVREALEGNLCRCTGLPEHREVDPGRRRLHERREGLRGGTDGRDRDVHRPAGPAQGRRRAADRPGAATSTTSDDAGHGCGWRWCARPTCTPRSTRSTRPRPQSMPGVIGVYTGADLEHGRAAVRVADHRGHQGPGALPAHDRQDPVRRRRRRGRRSPRPASRPRTRPRPSSSRPPSSRPSLDLREAAKDEVVDPRRPRAPTSSCTGATAARATRSVFESAPVIVQETLRPASADPERDGAARVPRVRRPRRWTSGRW